MILVETSPEADNFHLFNECIKACYPEHLWKSKEAEALPIIHLRKCFVIVIGDKAVARAAVYLNESLYYNMYNTACIGAYECINEITIARFLHKHLEAYCQSFGSQYIIGPMNGSTWENYRFNFQNTHPLFLTEQIQPEYYNDLFLDWGMEVVAAYFSSYTHEINFKYDGIQELNDYFVDQGAKIRTINLENYISELEKLHPFLLEAFQNNFLYTPIEKTAFVNKYLQYKTILKEDFVLVAEDNEDNIIGIFFCVEDLFNLDEKALIIKTIARNPAKKLRGLGHWMAHRLYQNAHNHGIQKIIHAFMKEEGTSSPISNNFSGIPFKSYKLYGKSI